MSPIQKKAYDNLADTYKFLIYWDFKVNSDKSVYVTAYDPAKVVTFFWCIKENGILDNDGYATIFR
jgi:hypothetical protein